MIDLKQNSLYLGSAAPTSGGGGGGGGSSFKMPLFTSHFYDINPNTADDNSWVESDGEWVSGTDYPEAYAMLVSEYDNPGSTIMGSLDSSKYDAVVNQSTNITFDGAIAILTGSTNPRFIRPEVTLYSNTIVPAINNANSWEIETKVLFGNFLSDTYSSPIIGGGSLADTNLVYNVNGTLRYYVSNTDRYSSANAYKLEGNITPLSLNTFYYFRIGYDGTYVYMKYSADGINFTLVQQKEVEEGTGKKPGVHAGGDLEFGNSFYSGFRRVESFKIDLSRTSIKVDGNVIWSPFTETGRKTPRNFIITTDDNMASTKFTSDGISWYYVLDKANTRFKLPRTTYNFVGTRGNTGSDVNVFEANSSTPAPSTEMGLYFYLGKKAVSEE